MARQARRPALCEPSGARVAAFFRMIHELPPLPFPRNALEPVMSAETIEYHYGKHHKGYVDKLNKLIVGTPFENMPLEQVVRHAHGPIFNNAAQAWNHTFFWNCLNPFGGSS